MRFACDPRLSPAEQRLYRQSDAVTEVPLRAPATLRPRVDAVGFFQRESSLFRQLLPPGARAGSP
ncbi:hypothetical protein D7X74_07165 [Corallococcus sp. CA047B]|uniref:hypothetical protein n=1 Tax=Corallococcus sp. CA047B TaxID=2316729 RepID=UPI000EA07A6E|nr:hypothetical protein [Corallococcus sp. CA047B]RKH19306.1 hypothetical protein D7X74_07165 [Corallococcus sp. CA047B]